jgi:translation initiation factor IF-3
MIKRIATIALFVFRPQMIYQSAANICFCRSLAFKKNKIEISHDDKLTKKIRPKTVPVPKITLLGPEKDISVVTMDVATKMCERRGLKLVKIIDIDTKTHRPVYQMMTANQFLKEDSKNHQNKDEKIPKKSKSVKTSLINCRIGQADLESKVNNFCKWLNKMHEVRVTITGDTANEIADEIIKKTQECSRVVQRREKGDSVKFQLLPLKVI